MAPLRDHGLRPGLAASLHGRRHARKIQKDNIMAITKPSIRRLARRAGVKRIQLSIYDTIRAILKARLADILYRIVQVIILAGAAKGGREVHNGRKTVTSKDVVFVLKQMGTPVYGFDWYELGREKTKRPVRPGRA